MESKERTYTFIQVVFELESFWTELWRETRSHMVEYGFLGQPIPVIVQ